MEAKTISRKDTIGQLKTENEHLRSSLRKEVTRNQLRASFLAEASHQLRSPLTNIQLSASLIELYYDRLDKDKILGHLDKIKLAVAHLVTIMDHYLLAEEADHLD